nr:peptidase M4 [Rhodothermus marinus]
TPRLSATEALAEARRRLAQPEAPTTTPELVVWPSEPPRLAWHFVLWPQDRPDEWVVLIDTHTGALLHVRSQAVQERPAKATRAKATAAWTSTAPLPVGLVTGEGMVFDPDPLATAGVAYGGAYADNDDADTPELNAERLVVTLPDITQGGDGLYRLEGPYVRITGDIPGYPSLYDPPAEATPDAFQYTRTNDHFEAVMAYYHIDRSQRYVQQLELGTPLQAAPIRVNPHGLEDQDNSMYLPGANAIVFGDGGVDDAEDATVIWHEYMHALLEDAAPGLLDEREGGALHEGWADYWAASYVRGLVEAGLVRRTDWDFVFRWDSGDGTIWEGRRIAFTGRYPEDTNCDREDTPRRACDKYQDGLLWATVLMEIQDVLGRAVTDRLAMAAALYLSPPATFRDAAQALLQADMDYYDGAHLAVLIDRLGARGLIDPGSIRLIVRHDPNQDVQVETDHLTLQVTAIARGDSVVRVQAFYEQAGQFVPTALFQPVNDTLFEGQIPWDGVPGRIR